MTKYSSVNPKLRISLPEINLPKAKSYVQEAGKTLGREAKRWGKFWGYDVPEMAIKNYVGIPEDVSLSKGLKSKRGRIAAHLAAYGAIQLAWSILAASTYTNHRNQLDKEIFKNPDFPDLGDLILKEGKIPEKGVDLGTVPSSPIDFNYKSPSNTLTPHNPGILHNIPLTEEQQGTVNWYNHGGGYIEHFGGIPVWLAGELIYHGGKSLAKRLKKRK